MKSGRVVADLAEDSCGEDGGHPGDAVDQRRPTAGLAGICRVRYRTRPRQGVVERSVNGVVERPYVTTRRRTAATTPRGGSARIDGYRYVSRVRSLMRCCSTYKWTSFRTCTVVDNRSFLCNSGCRRYTS